MGNHKGNPFARGVRPDLAIECADRFGHPINAGDVVAVNKNDILTFQVQEIKPNLDPNLPPNTLTIRMQTNLTIVVPRQARIQDVMKVVDRMEIPAHQRFGPTDAELAGADGEPGVGLTDADADTPSVAHPDPNPPADEGAETITGAGPKLVLTDK